MSERSFFIGFGVGLETTVPNHFWSPYSSSRKHLHALFRYQRQLRLCSTVQYFHSINILLIELGWDQRLPSLNHFWPPYSSSRKNKPSSINSLKVNSPHSLATYTHFFGTKGNQRLCSMVQYKHSINPTTFYFPTSHIMYYYIIFY